MKPRLVPRLLLPVLALSVLLLVTAVGSAWYLRSIQRQLSTALEENVASVVSGQRLESTVREIDASLDRYLITGDPAHLEAVPDLAERGRDALREAEAWAFTDRERELMGRARAGYVRLASGAGEAARTPRAPDTRGRVAAVAVLPESEILGPAREYRRLNEDALAGTSRATHELADRLTVVLLALGLCGAGGGLLGGWVLTTGLRRSIELTEGRMRGAAARLRSVVAVPGADGDPAEAVEVSVTAVLDRLRQVERDALRAEQLALVGQMAAGVAHEVRNPLMAIKLLVQAAADPHRAAPFRPRDLAVIEGEIVRLEGIVSGFLDFARPPAPDKQVVDLAPVVTGAVAAFRGRADLQKVALVVDVSAAAPAVHADPNQLRQVLHNLVGNALDAQPGGGEVRVTAAAAGGDVEVRVEDRGGGPPADLGERIFDPFVSTKPTGVGLGLSICRRIVESHGGAIRAVARPGGGAVFTVRLPRGS
ncbi:sensor histidine kinase [Urbifossiella limnaea]|uniref:histidine kinase n=1 Tax=Urbifossiella limnaea TaxID=2528023 RepID=A0A517XPJ8_9BACT|nr:ATP-binding protein [Urbifossiella limnaea]QDU19416.1 Sensor protein ZraS [Urbifossiella limnaea]